MQIAKAGIAKLSKLIGRSEARDDMDNDDSDEIESNSWEAVALTD